MSNHNDELVSVSDINFAIEEFIGKYPENVTTWVDNRIVTIQISNVGIRDKLFPRLTYLVENTVIENNLQIFNMPTKCVYVSNQIIRFTCTLDDLAIYLVSRNQKSLIGPRGVTTTYPDEKFFSRLARSKSLKSNGIGQLVNKYQVN